MTDEVEHVSTSPKQRWRALRGALKKIARDLDYRTPPQHRTLRYVVLEREQADALLYYFASKQWNTRGTTAALETALPQLVTVAFTAFKAELPRLLPGLANAEWETLKREEDRRRPRLGGS